MAEIKLASFIIKRNYGFLKLRLFVFSSLPFIKLQIMPYDKNGVSLYKGTKAYRKWYAEYQLTKPKQ